MFMVSLIKRASCAKLPVRVVEQARRGGGGAVQAAPGAAQCLGMATDFGSVQILALESFKFLWPRSFFFMPGPKNFLWPFTRAGPAYRGPEHILDLTLYISIEKAATESSDRFHG